MKLYAPAQEEARQGAEAATGGMLNLLVANLVRSREFFNGLRSAAVGGNGIKPSQDQSPSGND